LRKTKRTFS